MLTLNDGRAELWQWDTGRKLTVDADCSQVHFSNKVFGRSIDVDVADGVAIIPDILLQSDNDLNVWAFVGTAENGYTKISKTFKVNRRNKPADYVFTPHEQITLSELVDRITAAAEHPPVPGDNGCWIIWDVSAGAYRQSDVPVTVAPVDRTADMTQPVGRDQDGRLWTAPGGGGGGDENAVRYTAQELNDAQKEQARKNIGAGTSSFSGSYDDLTGKPTIPDGNLGITGASVGQIAKITAVDDAGKPTAWEPVDMPVGGSAEIVLLYDGEITVDSANVIKNTMLASCDDMTAFVIMMSWTANELTENGNDNMDLSIGNRAAISYGRLCDPSKSGNAIAIIGNINDDYSWAIRANGANSVEHNMLTAQIGMCSNNKILTNDKFSISTFSKPYTGTINIKIWGK